MERFFSPNLCIPVLKASFPETILRKLLSPQQAEIVSHLDGNATLGDLCQRLGQTISEVEHEIRKLMALDVVILCERSSLASSSPNPPVKAYASAMSYGVSAHHHEMYAPLPVSGYAHSPLDPSLSDSCPVVVGQVLENFHEPHEIQPAHPALHISSSSLSKASMDALAELHHLEQNSGGWAISSLPSSLEFQLDWTNPESCSSLQLNAAQSYSRSQYDAPQPPQSPQSLQPMQPSWPMESIQSIQSIPPDGESVFLPPNVSQDGFGSQAYGSSITPLSVGVSASSSRFLLAFEESESPVEEHTNEVNTFPEPPHREGMAASPAKEPWHRRWLFMDAAHRVSLPSAHTVKERKSCPSPKK